MEVLRVQEELLVDNDDGALNGSDYALENGGGLISNANAKTAFIECVNHVTINATPRGLGYRIRGKIFSMHLTGGLTTRTMIMSIMR
jgi:hypothetical protein